MIFHFQVLISQYRKRNPLGSAFINAYESRPLMHYRMDKTRRYNTLTFVEAVSQEPAPHHDDLQAAYRIAGTKFLGKLKKLFLILDDDVGAKLQNKSAGSTGKNKRRASIDGPSQKRKMPASQ